jgi:hypothetical protein
VPGCGLYEGLRGVLAGPDGRPQAAVSQPELLASLLARSPALAALAGPGPESWVARLTTPERRDRARRIFEDEGWVLQ